MEDEKATIWDVLGIVLVTILMYVIIFIGFLF